MDHIYADANEKYVKNTVVYLHTDEENEYHDFYVYLDKECTKKPTAEQLKNIYLKGMVMCRSYSGFYHTPVCGGPYDNGSFCVGFELDGDAFYSAEYVKE